jgi:hypothetical protein
MTTLRVLLLAMLGLHAAIVVDAYFRSDYNWMVLSGLTCFVLMLVLRRPREN